VPVAGLGVLRRRVRGRCLGQRSECWRRTGPGTAGQGQGRRRRRAQQESQGRTPSDGSCVPPVWHDNTILVIADLLEPLETPRSPRFEPRRIARWPWFKIRQLTDVSHCNLQHYLSCNRHRAVQDAARTFAGSSRTVASALLGQFEPAR
jgi:hypothetical protein